MFVHYIFFIQLLVTKNEQKNYSPYFLYAREKQGSDRCLVKKLQYINHSKERITVQHSSFARSHLT